MTFGSWRGWRLLSVVLVVLGLAVTAPPGAPFQAADHAGALVHPIFPHAHQSDEVYAHDGGAYALASHDPASQDVAPGLSVPQAGTGLHDGVGGIALPFALAILFVALTARRGVTELPLLGLAVAPATPPPRLVSRYR
ncbi:MAG: hypothetical protein IT306_16495 [Chloroflexi bacterium]|nr:hypothetical protein [Chloroflexota bacterium]